MSNCIYALGFFDGVHMAHQALLAQSRALASEAGVLSGAVTFGAHPDTLVLGHTPALISTPEDRERMLLARVDRVVTLPFDSRMLATPWQEFLDMLCREHNAAGFVCGDDFRFGAGGKGTPELLAEYCRSRGLSRAVVPGLDLDGFRVSSTAIRTLLERGDMERAVRFLGHAYLLTGTVVHGQQLGSRLGFPTANLTFPEGLAVPRFGVYACETTIDGIAYPAVTNIGTRPTVCGRGITAEAWIQGYEGSLYGREITLEFYAFLRPEMKFGSLEALTAAIMENARQSREAFALRRQP